VEIPVRLVDRLNMRVFFLLLIMSCNMTLCEFETTTGRFVKQFILILTVSAAKLS